MVNRQNCVTSTLFSIGRKADEKRDDMVGEMLLGASLLAPSIHERYLR
jgi:hypothetical protein